MPNSTLLDIATANGTDATVGLIEEIVNANPELEAGAARTIKGINFPTLVRVDLPAAGFRQANQGLATSKSRWERRVYETFFFNPQWECDVAVADSYEDGPDAWMGIEATGVMNAGARSLCRQFYYGSSRTAVAGDSLGFPGLLDFVDSSLTVDAGGTTDNVASSFWAVKWGPQAVQWVYGNNGQLTLSDIQRARVTDGSGNPYTALRQELFARVGIIAASKFACGRIRKLTTDSGKGLTDALIAQLVEKFPVGMRPDAFFCSRRSLGQLQRSRTATNATGTPAPTPQEWEGIPIYPTDSILDTETLALV